MTRRKGERTWRINERDYPHIVETLKLPCRTEDDYRRWGRAFDAMNEWHHARGIPIIRGGTRWVERNYETLEYMRWCYDDVATAQAFAGRFGGKIVPPIAARRRFRGQS